MAVSCCIAALLTTSELSSCVSHATCKESTTRPEPWLVGSTKDKITKMPTWLYHGLISYERTERLRNTLSTSEEDILSGVTKWICGKVRLRNHASTFLATIWSGGKHRGYDHEKANMVVSCRGNWLVAQHTPGEQDTVSGWTNWVSAAFTRKKKYADTQRQRNMLDC